MKTALESLTSNEGSDAAGAHWVHVINRHKVHGNMSHKPVSASLLPVRKSIYVNDQSAAKSAYVEHKDNDHDTNTINAYMLSELNAYMMYIENE